MNNLASYTPGKMTTIEYFIHYATTQERVKMILFILIVGYIVLALITTILRKINDRRKEKEYVSKFECRGKVRKTNKK